MEIPHYVKEMDMQEFLDCLDDYGDGHHYIHEAAKRIRELQIKVRHLASKLSRAAKCCILCHNWDKKEGCALDHIPPPADTKKTKILAQLDQIDREAKIIERNGDQGNLHSKDIQVLCKEIKLWFGYERKNILF